MKVETRNEAAPPSKAPAKPFSEILAGTGSAKKSGALPQPKTAQGKAAVEKAKVAADKLPARPGAPMQKTSAPAAKSTAAVSTRVAQAKQQVVERARLTSEKSAKTLNQAHSQSAEASRGRMEDRVDASLRSELARALSEELKAAPARPSSAQPDASSNSERKEASPEAGSAASGASGSAAPSQAQPSGPSAEQRAEAIASLVERISFALKQGQPSLNLDLAGTGNSGAVSIVRTGKGEVEVKIRGGDRSTAQELIAKLGERGLKVRSLEIS